MLHYARVKSGYDQSDFNQVLQKIYNIDRLLLDNNYNAQDRPTYRQLISILFEAAGGKFDLWEAFLNHLNKGNIEQFVHDKDNLECFDY